MLAITVEEARIFEEKLSWLTPHAEFPNGVLTTQLLNYSITLMPIFLLTEYKNSEWSRNNFRGSHDTRII